MRKYMKKNNKNIELHFFNPLIDKKKKRTLFASPTYQNGCPLKEPNFKITEIKFAPKIKNN